MALMACAKHFSMSCAIGSNIALLLNKSSIRVLVKCIQ